MAQNHVLDPTFFWDAIRLVGEFAFDAYIVVGEDEDDTGRIRYTFEKKRIKGSLQSQGDKLVQKKEGNYHEYRYEFYCRSLYRIKIGDFLHYKNRWLHVDEVHDFDEYGVRWVSAVMVELTTYRDLEEYVKYINGDIIV